MSEDDPRNTFVLPDAGEHEPKEIAARLIGELDEFKDLREGRAVVFILMRADSKVKQGRQILGEISLPRFQGALAPLSMWLLASHCAGAVPDYIMILDRPWWSQATPRAREALVYHELCHAKQAVDKDGELKFNEAGNPVWSIVGHDLEEFGAVVRRYGAWAPDIVRFIQDLREGGAI